MKDGIKAKRRFHAAVMLTAMVLSLFLPIAGGLAAVPVAPADGAPVLLCTADGPVAASHSTPDNPGPKGEHCPLCLVGWRLDLPVATGPETLLPVLLAVSLPPLARTGDLPRPPANDYSQSSRGPPLPN